MARRDALIVFVKLPAPGQVKTRLAKAVGADTAAALYRCFVADTLATARQGGHAPLVFFHPPESAPAMAAWLGKEITFLPQHGNDLGARMSDALRTALAGCGRAVLIGSDCPDLPSTLLQEAFEALITHQAVIGPAGDGGYYLIGFTPEGFRAAAFTGIGWGGPDVFRTTMARLTEEGIKVHILPAWNDVDDYDGLTALYDRHRGLPSGTLATIDFLRDHPGW
jgi:rSAM/selenodomain-associated transferase 1